jgi:phosphoribosylformylglycinamidine synthase subunit PurL
VSLYNETDGKAVYPTPVIGMVGILDDVGRATGVAFQAEGDRILLLGVNREEIGGSEYLYRTRDGLVAGPAPAVDLLAERQLQRAVLAMNEAGLVRSAHDCAEGGLATALAESAVGAGPFGVEVELRDTVAPVALFFGESTGRILVSVPPDRVKEALAIADEHDVPAAEIGTVGPRRGTFSLTAPRGNIRVPVEELLKRYEETLPSIMDRDMDRDQG